MLRKTLFMLALILSIGNVCAVSFVYEFRGVTLSEALAELAEDHPKIHINFIYNELDHYKVSTNVHTDDAQEALRRIIGLNPVSIVSEDGSYYIEALQHGRYFFNGKIVDSDNSPVAGATVMLLMPKDSTVITYGITDTQGRFSIPCDRKEVIGKISCVGHKTVLRRFDSFSVGTVILPEIVVALDEIKVKAEEGLLYADKSVYIPNSRQRSASNNAYDLLRRMAIPQVNVDVIDDRVSDNAGNDIKLFINGIPASKEDLIGMRTADVKKVEYLENPSDARFQGAPRVINFIMQLYEYGGYTKLTAWEGFLTGLNSRVEGYSAFSYKKINYGLYVGSVNSKTHIGGSDSEKTYVLKDGKVFRDERVDNYQESHNRFPVTFQASYNSEKTQIKNIVSFSNVSENISENGLVTTSVGDFQKESSYGQNSPNSSNNLSYSGYQYYSLPHDFSLSVEPSFNYSRIHDRYVYSVGQMPVSDRFAKEDAYTFNLDVYASKKVRKKHAFSMFLWSNGQFNLINYDGDVCYRDRFHHLGLSYGIKYNLILKNIYFNVDGGISCQTSRINKMKQKELTGFTHLNFQFAINRKNRLGLNFTYASGAAMMTMKSPDVLKMNELLYFTGNPDLRISPRIWTDINYNWLFTRKLWISVFGQYEGNINNYVLSYEPYSDATALIRSIKNDGSFHNEKFGLNFRINLLNGNLSLQMRPQINFYGISGVYNKNYIAPFLYSDINYYLGNFYFQAYYQLKNKYLSPYMDSITRTRDFYAVTAGWANNSWNIRLVSRNFFGNSKQSSNSESKSQYYSAKTTSFGIDYCPQINLSVSYTIGYGKKVERNNEVGERGGAASAIIKQ